MWGGLPVRDSKGIQTLMNKCARVILNKKRKTRTRTLMTEFGWLYFKELVTFHSIVLLFKTVKSGKPVNLFTRLVVNPDGTLFLPPGRLKIVRDSYMWRTVREWNTLPSYLISMTKLSVFKKNLKKFIIEGRPEIIARKPPDWD